MAFVGAGCFLFGAGTVSVKGVLKIGHSVRIFVHCGARIVTGFTPYKSEKARPNNVHLPRGTFSSSTVARLGRERKGWRVGVSENVICSEKN